jgi:hypothetical protein
MTLLFLIPGAFMLATENLINDATAIELGFNSVELGIFATGLYLFGVLVSEKSEWIMNKLSSKWLYAVLLIAYVSTLIIMPTVGLVLGGVLLFVRYGAATVFGNYESTRINAVIDSKYRATALSTFSLLRNIPYVFGATAIGLLMNLYTVRTFSLYFGILVVLSVGILYLSRPLFRDK